jgi:hypothetical protein
MEAAKRGRKRDRDPQELSDRHGPPDQPIERFASCVFDSQHRLPALAHKVDGSQRPRSVEIILECIFVLESSDALERLMLST